jgi:hypothetical protein
MDQVVCEVVQQCESGSEDSLQSGVAGHSRPLSDVSNLRKRVASPLTNYFPPDTF